MHAFGNRSQTTWPVINRVHRRDDGEQDLRGANVTCRFVAANVLLACLQRQSISWSAFGIVRNTDQTTGHVAFVLIAGCEKCGVWSAEPKWNSETLRATNRNIRAEFSRRL